MKKNIDKRCRTHIKNNFKKMEQQKIQNLLKRKHLSTLAHMHQVKFKKCNKKSKG